MFSRVLVIVEFLVCSSRLFFIYLFMCLFIYFCGGERFYAWGGKEVERHEYNVTLIWYLILLDWFLLRFYGQWEKNIASFSSQDPKIICEEYELFSFFLYFDSWTDQCFSYPSELEAQMKKEKEGREELQRKYDLLEEDYVVQKAQVRICVWWNEYSWN